MNITISLDEYKVIRKGLLELPAKESMALIVNLDQQVLQQNQVQKATPEEK